MKKGGIILKVSFEGIGENIVTFYNSKTSGAMAGTPVKMGGACEAAKCADGERFFGVAVAGDMEFAAVQTKGYVELPYSGPEPAVGFGKLAASGTDGVKTAETGGEFLIIDVDTTNKVVGFML